MPSPLRRPNLGDAKGLSAGSAADAERESGCGMLLLLFAGVVLLLGLVGAIAWVWLEPSLLARMTGTRRQASRESLERIGRAVARYRDVHGRFPPAFVADQDGRPLHSWRVLLLPYLDDPEAAAVYRQYRFDEPFDSPHNRALVDRRRRHYLSPAHPGFDGNPDLKQTDYVMIVGEGTISSGSERRRPVDVTDGLDRTILIVEVKDSGIPWAQPRDLEAENLDYHINGATSPGISSYDPDGAHVLLCDGTVLFLDNSTSPELLKAMATVAGGEDVAAVGNAVTGMQQAPAATEKP